MKRAISEYLDYSDREKKKIWQKSTFVFDTNVLLNLYRYPARARESLQEAIDIVREKTWLPYHVAWEFMRNRPETLFQAKDRYTQVGKGIDGFLELCQRELGLRADDNDYQELKAFLTSWNNKHREKNLLIPDASPQSKQDKILKYILEVFDERTGEPYSQEEYDHKCAEAAKRYAAEIPPGYKDNTKSTEGRNNNQYGDYIIWSQILDYAKAEGTDIVFITSDTKEDWWNIAHGKKFGPRCELRKEFADITHQKLLVYTPESFIAYANKGLGKDVDEITLREVSKFNSKQSEKSREFIKAVLADHYSDLARDILNEQENIEKSNIISLLNFSLDDQKTSSRNSQAVAKTSENQETFFDHLRRRDLQALNKLLGEEID